MAITIRRKSETTAGTPETLLGIGIYSVPEAARLLRAPLPSVRRWAKGYTFRRRLSRRVSRPVIRRQLAAEPEEIITFLDLIELHFVVIFRSQGVSLATIRKAAENAARQFNTDHPFAVRRFDTDGRSIFATMIETATSGGREPQTKLVQELEIAQYVFGDQVEPFFRKLDYGVEGAERYWPLGRDKCVVLDPARAFGKPIDVATGVPTWPLYQAVLGGEEVQTVARWYEVAVGTVKCAVEYEKSLVPAGPLHRQRNPA